MCISVSLYEETLSWRCIAVNYGADSCVDFLEVDEWEPVTAQDVCTLSSPDAAAVIEVCDEFVDCCKALAPTRTPYRWTKRCTATWIATDTPAPHEPYYVYLPNFFPDNVCFNNLGGTLLIEPTGVFPAYSAEIPRLTGRETRPARSTRESGSPSDVSALFLFPFKQFKVFFSEIPNRSSPVVWAMFGWTKSPRPPLRKGEMRGRRLGKGEMRGKGST